MPRLNQAAEILEDLTFLADHHVGAHEAARRTGFTSYDALEKWCDRKGHRALHARLRANDPASLWVQPRKSVA